MASSGAAVLRDAATNKDTAFTEAERDALGVRGLIPAVVTDRATDEDRIMWSLRRYGDDTLGKYCFLMTLRTTNESLFFSTVLANVSECMPLVYTPVVGAACINYGRLHVARPGLFIGKGDKGRVRKVLDNWPQPDVKAIVFTDGERILGLGDLGACGMGIPVGKLALYTVCAGVNPAQCLPVTLDVGTNNEEFLADPFYIGAREKRLEPGGEYDELVDEFMHAAADKYGEDCVLQFEDFGNRNAARLLHKYQDKMCTFNDDIQGTASVVLAGLINAVRRTDKPLLKDHTLLFLGAGEAGTGIAELVAYAACQEVEGLTIEQARANIWLIDSKGLVCSQRADADRLAHYKVPFAHDHEPVASFAECIERMRPTVLLGVSAQHGAFTSEILTAFSAMNDVPLVFALSNPTSKCECTAAEAYEASEGRAIFVSGSPFDPVDYKGRTIVSGQGNNAYIFPGVALGSIAVKNTRINDHIFYVAAKTLAEETTAKDIASGCMYPQLSTIRDVSVKIAAAVAADAYDMGTAKLEPRPEDLEAHCRALQYDARAVGEASAAGGAGSSAL